MAKASDYRVTLERTRPPHGGSPLPFRQAGARRTFTLTGAYDSIEQAADFVRRTDCAYQPWELVSIEPVGDRS